MLWLSRINEHSTYVGGLLGPMLAVAAGLGLLFVPMSLVSLSKVGNRDAGVASSMLNVGQQVGGSIGLAILGTVAWSSVADTLRSGAAGLRHHGTSTLTAADKAAAYSHALAVGFSKGFEVSAGVMALALVITVLAIRVKRRDLAGADLTVVPAA
jgi:hypothetical protein